MSFITSAAGLSKAEKICRLSNVKKRLIMGEKRVTKAITTMSPPVTVLIVAADCGCANLVAKATELQLPILKLATRTEVGNIVGYPSASACVLSFPGDQDLLAELVHLG